MTDQRAAAFKLLGNLVRFAHQPEGPYYLCVSANKDGMVEVLGLSGVFAPHLFVVVEELC
jgi:hypothetical protein